MNVFAYMRPSPSPFSVAIVLLLLVTAAHTEEMRKVVMHDGALYAIEVADQMLTISFLDPPADLRELGAARGAILLSGTWTPTGVLEAEAYAFAAGCAPIAYPVRGIVDHAGQLVVIGPQPVLQGCKVTGSQWTEGSIMRFASARPPEEPRSKPKAKPKPKSKPIARPRAQPTIRQPWENQWQWQWR